jgi:hypothetical protein
MIITHHWLIDIYFSFNMFMAGHFFSEKWVWQETRKEKLRCLINVVILMIAAGIIFPAVIIWELLKALFWKVETFFQVRFWFRYYFTDHYKKMNRSKLIEFNKALHARKDIKALNYRIYAAGIRKINALNNFKYDPNNIEEEEN